MGRLFAEYHGPSGKIKTIFTCKSCGVFLTNRDQLISTKFQGASGKAILFNRSWNVKYGDCEQREMMTGDHIVRDVFCKFCETKVGWMYEFAFEEQQQYKEAKVILERSLIDEVKDSSGEDDGDMLDGSNEVSNMGECPPSDDAPVLIDPKTEQLSAYKRQKLINRLFGIDKYAVDDDDEYDGEPSSSARA